MAWYYKDGDQEIGPVEKDELQQLIKSGKISGQTQVRNASSDQWRTLVEMVKGKRAETGQTPPEPPADGAAQSAETPTAPPQTPTAPPSDAPPDRTEPDTSPMATARMPFRFSGSGGEYFKIWIVNIVLSVLTLGIYSAWAKVRRKQYFYGNTSVNDASFQYLADPVKILKGRIVVFGGFLVYSLVGQFFPLVGPVLILAFLPALPWFIVRAMSFNARNSAIRNIRFNFLGTYWDAAKAFVLWPILVPFTLGILAPFVFYRQKKFVVQNCTYGTTRFAFKATARDYYRLVFKLLIPLLVFALAATAAEFLVPVATGVFYAVSAIVFYLYAMAYFMVKSSNLLFNSSQFSGHGFKATMALKEYAIIVVTNTLATALTLGLFHPFAQVRAYRYKISQLALMPAGNLDRFLAAEQEQVSALGDEMSDFMDFDLGL